MLHITKYGAICKFSELQEDDRRRIEEAATYSWYSKFHKATMRRTLLSRMEEYLCIPRCLATQLFPAEKTKYCLPAAQPIATHKIGELRPHQVAICDAIMSTYFCADRGASGLILKLDMGAGKSFIAMELIDRLRLKTLIVCHVANMVAQWKKNLSEWFAGITIGEFRGGTRTDGDVVIGLIQSLSKMPQSVETSDFFTQFGFAIFDEAHLYCSMAFSNIFATCNAKYMMGLSGTPHNKDNSHKVIEWNIGPIFDADSLQVPMQVFRARVMVVNFHAEARYARRIFRPDGNLDFPAMLGLILSDPSRRQLVVQHIKNLAAMRNVFVFADRRKYLEELQEAVPELTTAYIVGGTSESDLLAAEKSAQVIFTTYQYMSTGKSIVKMNALIFATPRQEKIAQTLGRIFRNGSSDETRMIVDIVDAATILARQANSRRELYRERGYEIAATHERHPIM